jgi:hypothetical protein
MGRSIKLLLIVVFVLSLGQLLFSEDNMPFGGDKDVQFAKNVWTAMDGYRDWKMVSGFYPGQSPHGKVLRLYYNLINVDGKPYHIIVKDNFGGDNASVESVSKNPNQYLAAVTIMVQMEKEYDPDNNNWFYAKYNKDGRLDKNAKDMAMAGRVAKGMNVGCIACHKDAKGNDFVFSND